MPKTHTSKHNSSNESDSTTSDEEHRRRKQAKQTCKKQKKLKKKKKEKYDKVKKNRNRTTSTEQTSPQIEILVPANSSDNADTSVFGPILPPHLLNPGIGTKPPIIGPILPSHILKQSQEEPENQREILINKAEQVETDDENDDALMFGPSLPEDPKNASTAQIKLEERALALKLAVIERSSGTGDKLQDVREEWMLELPEVGLKGGLAALNNMKRTFYQGKDRPDFSDRSSWTKTPQTGASSTTEKPSSSKDLEKSALTLYEHQRDEEQERMARKHKKKHKRDESLVEIHQKKLRKEERKKLKELAATGSKPERRPFSRDVDLKLNKIDSHQTKQIVDKAKILNTKFSSGQSKYL